MKSRQADHEHRDCHEFWPPAPFSSHIFTKSELTCWEENTRFAQIALWPLLFLTS